jgi:F-box/leucine-rich repeat protein 14
MPNLQEVNLRSCDNISDTGIGYLSNGSAKISSLDVSFCDKIGDQSLQYIAQGFIQIIKNKAILNEL